MVNILQLPLVVMDEILTEIDTNNKLELIKVNKYFNSLVTSILYRDIINLREQPDSEDFNEGLDDTLNKIVPELLKMQNRVYLPSDLVDIDTPRKSELFLAVLNHFREQVAAVNSKTWNELLPTIKKYNHLIRIACPIDHSNFLTELEIYSNLKQYTIYIQSEEQITQLVNYQGNAFRNLKVLKLCSDFISEVEDEVLHGLDYRGGLVQEQYEKYIFRFNLKWLNYFNSSILTHLNITCLTLKINFFITINLNFPNLREIRIYSKYCEPPKCNVELPTFSKLTKLSVVVNEPNYSDLTYYLTDTAYWPKVKHLELFLKSPKPFKLVGGWTQLQSLNINSHIRSHLFKFDNLSHLVSLSFNSNIQFENVSLETLLSPLIHLQELCISNFSLLPSSFDFQPKFQLRKLDLSHIRDCTEPLLNFIRSQISCRALKLTFFDVFLNGTDDEDELAKTLAEEPNLLNLTYLFLEDVPDQLEQWLIKNSPHLHQITRISREILSVRYL